MAFHFTRSRPTQHLLTGGVLAVAIAVASTHGFQQAWSALVTATPDPVLLTAGPLALHLLTFWPVAMAFHYVDTHDAPTWIARHRIQSGPPRRPPLGRTLRVLAWNQLFWSPLLLVGMAAVLRARGWEASPTLPSVTTLLMELAGLSVAAIVVFYAVHRFLHRTWWMKRVHRVHHEFKTTSALASEYAHPFEFCVGNFGALAAGVVILAPSLPAIYLFTVLSLLLILVHHSGYALPWAPWSVPHDWHHYKVTELFGTLGVIDRALGTDPTFRTLTDGQVVGAPPPSPASALRPSV